MVFVLMRNLDETSKIDDKIEIFYKIENIMKNCLHSIIRNNV